jgi:hypothetical protein
VSIHHLSVGRALGAVWNDSGSVWPSDFATWLSILLSIVAIVVSIVLTVKSNGILGQIQFVVEKGLTQAHQSMESMSQRHHDQIMSFSGNKFTAPAGGTTGNGADSSTAQAPPVKADTAKETKRRRGK